MAVKRVKNAAFYKSVDVLGKFKGNVGFNENQNIYYGRDFMPLYFIPLYIVATDNEFGAVKFRDDGNYSYIPPRPFLSTTFSKNQSKYFDLVTKKVRMFFNAPTKKFDLDSEMTEMAKDVSKSIADWEIPPNAPETIKKKGFDDPLVETGTMRDNVIFWDNLKND